MKQTLLTMAACLLVFGAGARGADPVAEAPKPAKAAARNTEITAEKEAQFDSAGRVAVFLGSVEVKDTQFNLQCDKLTAYLDKQGGGLERAEAEGNVVIVSQRPASDGSGKSVPSRGKSARATYDPKSGDVVLIGWPQIQQGINLHVATDPNTRMIINNDGHMKTLGRSKTIIKDTEKE